MSRSSIKSMTSGSPWKLILGFAAPMLLGMIAAESTAHIPALAWLDSDAHWRRQLPVLLAGAACYAALLPLACRISEGRFERVDL